jgi:predicted small secreted protein
MESMKTSRIAAVLVVAGLLALTACGGGTGVGPGEIEKREARLRDRFPPTGTNTTQRTTKVPSSSSPKPSSRPTPWRA